MIIQATHKLKVILATHKMKIKTQNKGDGGIKF